MFTIIALILGVVTILTIIKAAKLSAKKKEAGINGKVRDHDLDGKGHVYHNEETGISAKPDVVINLAERRKKVIEVKKAVCKTKKPYKADVIQIAAEMEAVGTRDGEIRYSNKTFVVNLTQELKKELHTIKSDMEKSKLEGLPPEGTPTKKKCGVCDFRAECTDVAV